MNRYPRAAVAFILTICVLAAARVTPRPTPPPFPPGPAPRVTVRDASFHSASLNRDMKYRILLPAGYETSTQRYPVLYLLHGLNGSYVDWESKTHLDEYVAPLPLIVVMPDAGDSWYTNSAANPQDRFEDYIAKDLVAEVDKTYRTVATRHARGIGGLSMGGYGAMKFALKYPQLFVFAASFSAAINGGKPDFYIPFGEKFNQQHAAIYGPPDSATRAENIVFELAKKADPARLPFLWLVCGTEDGLRDSNLEFVKLLGERKIAHYYAESAGAHTWQYWDEQLPVMLATFFHRHLRPQAAGRKKGAMPSRLSEQYWEVVRLPVRRARSFPGRRCSIAPKAPLPGACC